mmetsp:Transcript_70736/g.207165  ORF Transcript_70736/g.207165 Transcript_70736/m.207165 type:complete len:244 (+) Transcript_70736:550-1281(+)
MLRGTPRLALGISLLFGRRQRCGSRHARSRTTGGPVAPPEWWSGGAPAGQDCAALANQHGGREEWILDRVYCRGFRWRPRHGPGSTLSDVGTWHAGRGRRGLLPALHLRQPRAPEAEGRPGLRLAGAHGAQGAGGQRRPGGGGQACAVLEPDQCGKHRLRRQPPTLWQEDQGPAAEQQQRRRPPQPRQRAPLRAGGGPVPAGAPPLHSPRGPEVGGAAALASDIIGHPHRQRCTASKPQPSSI